MPRDIPDRDPPSPDAIKALRRAMGMTAEDFAREAGVSHNTIYAWESGRVTPSRRSALILRHLMADVEKGGAY